MNQEAAALGSTFYLAGSRVLVSAVKRKPQFRHSMRM
jgi:hypothetical protein